MYRRETGLRREQGLYLAGGDESTLLTTIALSSTRVASTMYRERVCVYVRGYPSLPGLKNDPRVPSSHCTKSNYELICEA